MFARDGYLTQLEVYGYGEPISPFPPVDLIWRKWTTLDLAEVQAWRMENGTVAELLRPGNESPVGSIEGSSGIATIAISAG